MVWLGNIEEIKHNTTHTNETKLFLGNTQQISDSKGRRRDVKQENVILYINERKSRNDLINIAKYDLK